MVNISNNNIFVDETMTPWEHLETFIAKIILNMLILKYGANKYNFTLTLKESNIIINSDQNLFYKIKSLSNDLLTYLNNISFNQIKKGVTND